jgi:hypothetical protein
MLVVLVQSHGQGALVIIQHQRHLAPDLHRQADTCADSFNSTGLLAGNHLMVGNMTRHLGIKPGFIQIEVTLEITIIGHNCRDCLLR